MLKWVASTRIKDWPNNSQSVFMGNETESHRCYHFYMFSPANTLNKSTFWLSSRLKLWILKQRERDRNTKIKHGKDLPEFVLSSRTMEANELRKNWLEKNMTVKVFTLSDWINLQTSVKTLFRNASMSLTLSSSSNSNLNPIQFSQCWFWTEQIRREREREKTNKPNWLMVYKKNTKS